MYPPRLGSGVQKTFSFFLLPLPSLLPFVLPTTLHLDVTAIVCFEIIWETFKTKLRLAYDCFASSLISLFILKISFEGVARI